MAVENTEALCFQNGRLVRANRATRRSLGLRKATQVELNLHFAKLKAEREAAEAARLHTLVRLHLDVLVAVA
jgi:hypothetical protein